MKKPPQPTPRSMNMHLVHQIFQQTLYDDSQLCFGPNFVVSAGVNFLDRLLVLNDKGPYCLEDYRFGLLLEGEIHATINLIPTHITAGQYSYLGQGSIIQLHQASPGAIMKGCILSPDIVNRLTTTTALPILSNPATSFVGTATASDREFLEQMLRTVWQFIHQEAYPERVLHTLFAAIIEYYNHLYVLQHNLNTDHLGRANLFNQFISLVNAHCDEARAIAYYADRLCLSPRYFSSLIQEQSGHTAKHWIDKAVVTRAKILLRHSPKTISQISAELHFPNDSFFCKFFRRLTGMSPTAYREQG